MRGGGIESLPAGSVVVHVGQDGFVMPWPEFRATPSQLARLAVVALLTDGDQFAPVRKQLLAEIEAEMDRENRRRARLPEGRATRTPADVANDAGPIALRSGKALGLPAIVTDHGRLYQPDPHRDGYDANRAPVMAKFDRMTVERPEGVRIDRSRLKDSERELLDEAERKLASAESKKDARAKITRYGEIIGYGRMTQGERDERRYAQSILTQLNWALLSRSEADQQKRIAAEQQALEERRGRGGMVIENGRRRRTGVIERLVNSGVLTAAEGAGLEKYGDVFERTREKLRSQMGASNPGAPAIDLKREELEQARMDADRATIQAAEAYVRAQTKNGRAVMILREVAGRGRSIHQVGGGGATRERNRQALVIAGQCMADFWGLT